MHVSRGKLVFLVIALVVFVGWKNFSRSAHETALLHIPLVGNQDTYARVWVVEDTRNVWIRAESPQRVWLKFLRDNPVVELRREGSSVDYRAIVIDTADARAYVDPMFRRKYGTADELRAMMSTRDTIPVRLERP